MSKYQLDSTDPLSYKILGEGPFEVTDFNGNPVDEAKRFDETVLAMSRSGFSYETIENIVDVIVALLHIGNV